MFAIDADQTIHITRGDIGVIELTADKSENEQYVFQTGDLVRFKVYARKDHDNVVLIKDVCVESENSVISINLYKSDTKIGTIINKPVDYWYEVEVNPETAPQTIIGYDKTGPKIFRLYPEGGEGA